MTPAHTVRREIVMGFLSVAAFHEAAGNLRTGSLMREHARDVARLEVHELEERAEVEGELLVRCVRGAPFRGIA